MSATMCGLLDRMRGTHRRARSISDCGESIARSLVEPVIRDLPSPSRGASVVSAVMSLPPQTYARVSLPRVAPAPAGAAARSGACPAPPFPLPVPHSPAAHGQARTAWGEDPWFLTQGCRLLPNVTSQRGGSQPVLAQPGQGDAWRIPLGDNNPDPTPRR